MCCVQSCESIKIIYALHHQCPSNWFEKPVKVLQSVIPNIVYAFEKCVLHDIKGGTIDHADGPNAFKISISLFGFFFSGQLDIAIYYCFIWFN